MTADKEPRSPLDYWAAKASREVMFVMMLGWNLDGREGNQARMEPVCWGWRSRQWARAEAPHILLPLTQGVRDNVKVYWSGKCATDMHRHRSLPQDAGWCPGVSSAGIPSPPMAALSQTACDSWGHHLQGRCLFQRKALFSASKTNSYWNLSDFSKSTIKAHTSRPRYHVTMQVQKAPGDGGRVGVGMKQLCARVFISFNVSK